MTPTLKHYAREPHLRFDRRYNYGSRRGDFKPAGFWVSVQGGDDWREWCTSENYHTDLLANEHDVILTPEANILLLDTLASVESLATRFPRFDSGQMFEDYPNWRQIAAEYDGLIIAPYQWGARWDVSWYYSWDCASGCIWNLDAIASVEPLMAEALRR